MRRVYLALMLTLTLAAEAAAGCYNSTGPLVLQKLRVGDPPSTWIGCVNSTIDTLSSGAAMAYSTSAVMTADWLQVRRISGLSTGTAGVWISSTVTLGAGTSSTTVTGALGVLGGGGLGVTYGINAATGVLSGQMTAQTFKAQDGYSFYWGDGSSYIGGSSANDHITIAGKTTLLGTLTLPSSSATIRSADNIQIGADNVGGQYSGFNIRNAGSEKASWYWNTADGSANFYTAAGPLNLNPGGANKLAVTATGVGVSSAAPSYPFVTQGDVVLAADSGSVNIGSNGGVFPLNSKLRVEGDVAGSLFQDTANFAYYIDPAHATQSANLYGRVSIGAAGAASGSLSSPESFFIDIDYNNDQTDRALIITKDANTTTLVSVYEDGYLSMNSNARLNLEGRAGDSYIVKDTPGVDAIDIVDDGVVTATFDNAVVSIFPAGSPSEFTAAGVLSGDALRVLGGDQYPSGGSHYPYGVATSSPIWVGENAGAPAAVLWRSNSAGADSKTWSWVIRSGKMQLEAVNDDQSTINPAIAASRSGATATKLEFLGGVVNVGDTYTLKVAGSVAGDWTSYNENTSATGYGLFVKTNASSTNAILRAQNGTSTAVDIMPPSASTATLIVQGGVSVNNINGATAYAIRTSTGIRMDGGCLTWADGTKTCTHVSPTGGVTTSTATTWPGGYSYSQGSTVFNECVPGSTVTMTTSGSGRIVIAFTGSVILTGAANSPALQPLMDGAFIDSMNTTTIGAVTAYVPDGKNGNMSFSYEMKTTPSAASHSWCLRARVGAGTLLWPSTDVTQFRVTEVQ